MKTKRILTGICLLFLAFSGFAQNMKNVDAETFKKMLDAKQGMLIDLRTNDEINKKGMIRGARQIDFLANDAEKQIMALDKNKTYLVYCAGGGRSEQCAELMQKNGFREVVNLEKGYDDWKRKGFETVARDNK